MRCIKITHNNMNVRITLWLWSWFHFWFRSWFWCRLNLRFRSRFYLWFRSRSWYWFNLRFRSWFNFWLRLRFWYRFIFTIYVFTLTILIGLPCNITFFSMTRCKYCKTTRFRTIRCNSYCTLKVSFTINIVMIVHLVSQVI